MVEPIFGQEGQCRCGQVQFKVSAAPLITMACHCTGCQRMTASAYSLSALYLSDHFKVTLGRPVIGGLHGATRHFFCASCMSWLFTRPEGMDQVVNVRATMLDGARGFRPFLETYTEEMLPWAKTPAAHSFPQFPPRELFPELIAEFARRSA
jgi:hypothetical protein